MGRRDIGIEIQNNRNHNLSSLAKSINSFIRFCIICEYADGGSKILQWEIMTFAKIGINWIDLCRRRTLYDHPLAISSFSFDNSGTQEFTSTHEPPIRICLSLNGSISFQRCLWAKTYPNGFLSQNIKMCDMTNSFKNLSSWMSTSPCRDQYIKLFEVCPKEQFGFQFIICHAADGTQNSFATTNAASTILYGDAIRGTDTLFSSELDLHTWSNTNSISYMDPNGNNHGSTAFIENNNIPYAQFG